MLSKYWLGFTLSSDCEVKMVKFDMGAAELKKQEPTVKEDKRYCNDGHLYRSAKRHPLSPKEELKFKGGVTTTRRIGERKESVSSNDSIDMPIEEIVLDSSDSSENDESNLSAMCSGCAERSYKKVVTPPAFDPSGTQSLQRYLVLYERYFYAKFRGGQRECSMELEKFLTGDALSAYKTLDGSEKHYSVLKERLLDWFRTYQVQGAKRWKRELKNVNMKNGDSFKLFALRVHELAQKAYPQDKKECVRRMQERFTKATPGWFNEKLQQRQDMKEIMGLGKKLNWSDMVKQAEKEDKVLRDKRWKRTEITAEVPELGVWQTQGIGFRHGKVEQPQQEKVFTNKRYYGNREAVT